jgi:Domain of unknown function (DUF5671)
MARFLNVCLDFSLTLTPLHLRYNPRMPTTPDLREFLAAARAQGASDQTLVALLRGRGWPEDDVHHALADSFESETGLTVPIYKRSGSAKDAFFYLLAFATLSIWTIGLGSAMFTLIQRWFPDPVAPRYYYTNGYYEMASALASIIIAFPIYLLVTRHILREVQAHPEKLDSPIRKWLTYLALFIAAGCVVCDLITFLTYFLRGELTARFVAKVATVLIISGGVFWYYFGGLRKSDSAAPPAPHPLSSGSKP